MERGKVKGQFYLLRTKTLIRERESLQSSRCPLKGRKSSSWRLMEGRPERIADYFVVVGVGSDSVSKFEPFSSEEGVSLPADQQNASCQEPVTDIAVFYSKHEQLPKGYK